MLAAELLQLAAKLLQVAVLAAEVLQLAAAELLQLAALVTELLHAQQCQQQSSSRLAKLAPELIQLASSDVLVLHCHRNGLRRIKGFTSCSDMCRHRDTFISKPIFFLINIYKN